MKDEFKQPQFFDIHSHLDTSDFDIDREEVIRKMEEESVSTITVGTDKSSSAKAVEIAKNHNSIFACIGLHPTDSREDFDEEFFKELAKDPKVVSVGECGLDYFRIKDESGDPSFATSFAKATAVKKATAGEEKKRQKNIFEKQIDFAVSVNKPLMIHCRDAHNDVLDILNSKKMEYGEKLRGNIHFFSGDVETAKKYFDIDFTLSFNGVITFADSYNEVIKYSPIERIMSETDSPFVAPIPYRGKRNCPIFVKEVVKKIAEIRGEDYLKVKEKMVQNAKKYFGL